MPHHILIDAVFIVHWLGNVPGWNYTNCWTLQPFKLEGQDEAHPSKWSQILYILIFFTISPLLNGLKRTRLNKIQISTSKSSLSEVNFSSSWRNTLVHILLEYIAESPMLFTVINTIITSDPIPYMLVTFYWFL